MEMINFMKEGEFVKANDIYLLTAIGNAPWPIGLTMVGIHERSGNFQVRVLHGIRVEMHHAFFVVRLSLARPPDSSRKRKSSSPLTFNFEKVNAVPDNCWK